MSDSSSFILYSMRPNIEDNSPLIKLDELTSPGLFQVAVVADPESKKTTYSRLASGLNIGVRIGRASPNIFQTW